MAQQHSDAPQPAPGVFPRGDIPVSGAPENKGLEVRPFLAHQTLSRMLPPSTAALAWVRAHPGRDVGRRSHKVPSMLIVVQGTATLLGDTPRQIEKGDVVTIPRHHEYGFTAIGVDGLHAVHVVFRDDESTRKDVESLARLLERNAAHAREAHNNLFFRRLRETGLDLNAKASMLREVFRVFADAFHAMLFMRQALCRDEVYCAVFQARFRERLMDGGATGVVAAPGGVTDPILRSTMGWFSYQVLNLDNAGKAVLHLVLETAQDHLRALVNEVVPNDHRAEHLSQYKGNDGQMPHIVELLEGHHPSTYRHLEQVLGDAWNVFEAMIERVAALIERERSRC